MSINITEKFQLKILQYLYKFKDDREFHGLDQVILNLVPKEQRTKELSELYYNGLVSFWNKPDEIKEPAPFAFLLTDSGTKSFYEDEEPIYARIDSLGIKAVESFNDKTK